MTASTVFEKTVGTVVTTRHYTLIHLPEMTSNGRSGAEWVADRDQRKLPTADWAKDILTIQHTDGKAVFVATTGVIYKPVVLLGSDFTGEERTTENIRKVARDLKLITPPAELGTLVRDTVTNEEINSLGLKWLVTMHEPIEDSASDPVLLAALAYDAVSWLYADYGELAGRWGREYGFVFLSPQEVSV